MPSPSLSPAGESFPRHFRIANRRDFLRAYEGGKKYHSRSTIWFVIANDLGHPRLGITVTRKFGKSHDRNRVKRWIREAFRLQRASSGIDEASVDLVVNVKRTARDATYQELSAEIAALLRRIARSENDRRS